MTLNATQAAKSPSAAYPGEQRARLPATEWIGYFRDLITATGDRARTQRDAALVFAVRVVSAALIYLTQIVFARWMGGFEYGIFVFVWTWVLILGGLSHCGLNLAALRLLPVYREHANLPMWRGLIRGARIAALACGTIVMAAGLAGVALLGDRIEDHYVLPLYLALICIPLYTLTDVQDGIGRGNGWMATALIPPYVLRPILLLASMVAAHLAGFTMTAATAAGAAIVATWATGIIQALLIRSSVRATVPPGPSQYEFGTWFTAATPIVFTLASELLLQNTDIIVIARTLSPTEAGIYFAAAKTMALIMFVHYAVGSAMAHKFAALQARGDKAGLEAHVRDAVNWTFWPSLAGAAFILALGKPLLWLFGPQFETGYPVMAILVVGFLFRSSMGPAEHLLNMLGHQRLCAFVMCTAALLNVALNLMLVPKFGIIGAAVATATSLITVATLGALAVHNRLGIKIAVWNNWRRH